MADPTEGKLAALGAERLAGALLDLACRNEDAARLVERLTAEPDLTGRRFKAGLEALRRRDRPIPYHEAGSFAARLGAMLEDLEAGVKDPQTGVELVAAFYRSDSAIFEASDDSDGLIGDIFRQNARDLFQRYAARCDDEEWLAEYFFALLHEDDYGVRDSVLDGAARYIPEAVLRDLAARMWQAAESAPGAKREPRLGGPKAHWFLLLEQVARELNDPRLFEGARRALSPELGVAACIDIGAEWLAAGDPVTALSWLERILPVEPFLVGERDDLLREIHEKLGHPDEVERLAWKRFHRARGTETLQDLLQVIGPERRAEVVAVTAADILQAKEFSASDALFLMECERTEEAAMYVVERRVQLDGGQWPSLVPLAEGLEASGRVLGATAVYRALLDSILSRGKSPIYRHGRRYLRRLGKLAGGMEDWEGISPHEEYLAGLRVRHSRKRSFWALFDGSPLRQGKANR